MKKIILIPILALAISACGPKNTTKETIVENEPVFMEMNLKIDGMTCDHCEASIQNSIMVLSGIDSISANYEDSTAFIRYEPGKIKLDTIIAIIKTRGYSVAKISAHIPIIPLNSPVIPLKE
jgi:copper chaperone CopZ